MRRTSNQDDGRGAFEKAYASINVAQKKAVDTTEGPVMVIAGPGTGKTQILTLRIGHILKTTDTRPENILALTFTDSGAVAMRQRLLKYIGSDAYKVGLYTFHSFAGQLIGRYPDAYPNIIGARVASEIEKIQLIQDILDGGSVELLRPAGDPRYYVSHILRTISELKQEYVTPDAFVGVIADQEKLLLSVEQFHSKGAHKGKVRSEYQKLEKSIAKNKELLFIYRAYEAALRSLKLYDFNDMIVETIHALENNEDMLFDVQESYQYILADEHQDVNGSQNKILELLSGFHASPNLFVVGDEKQAIYRFQGASLENFLHFETQYKDTQTIALLENYRSAQVILDVAHSLVAVEEGPLEALRVPLKAQEGTEGSVSLDVYSHVHDEDAALLWRIKELLEKGVPPEEIAVIVRTNKEVEQFSVLLRKEGLSVEASIETDVLRHPLTRAIATLIEALSVSNERALFEVLHGPHWGIDAGDLVRVLRARSYVTPLRAIVSDPQKLEELALVHAETVHRVHTTLQQASQMLTLESPIRVLEFLLTESGLLDYATLHNPLEGGAVIRQIYDEIATLLISGSKATLADVPRTFALYETYNVPLTVKAVSTTTGSVTVLTAHKSKGLEYAYVFVPHLTDSTWGERMSRTYFDIPKTKYLKKDVADTLDESDDERRLLYVALTRAKKEVFLSYSTESPDGKNIVPSRFLSELDMSLVHTTEHDGDGAGHLETLGILLQKPALDGALCRAHLGSYGLSATALNNYLTSPWNYFYRNVLRIPEVQNESMLYGTVVHGVMEQVTKVYGKSKTTPSVTEIKKYLDDALGKLPLTDIEYARMHEKALAELLQYITSVVPHMPHSTKEEFTLDVTLHTGIQDFEEVRLTGKLDRLDFDAEGNLLRVCDYKTGKPKTRGEIEGTTKASNGEYKRQLTFYALLLKLYADERMQSRTGVLSFVQADPKGKIHEEVYEITDAEIEALTAEIIRVVEEIVTGSFLESPCDGATSEYCDLVELLKNK